MLKNKYSLYSLGFLITLNSVINICSKPFDDSTKGYLSDRPNNMLKLDIINCLNELNKINALGSHNKEQIKFSAKVGKIFSLISNYSFSIIALANYDRYYAIDKKLDRLHPFIGLARIAKLAPSLSALTFYCQDSKIEKNSKQITDYNKETNRDLSTSKLKQFVWLAANKVLPYIGFGLSRKIHDKIPVSGIFGNSLADSDGQSVQLLEVLRSLANISEIVRKYYRYKAEVSDYKSYMAK